MSCEQVEYFQFVDQQQPLGLAKELNFAVFNSNGSLGSEWSLCSSMYIGFVRARLTFFAVGQKDTGQPLFWLVLTLDDGKLKTYFHTTEKAHNFGYLRGHPKIHDWNHACISQNMSSGYLVAYINGQKMHDGFIEEMKMENTIELKNRLVLGTTPLGVSQSIQSEGSVGNVNTMIESCHQWH